MNQATAPVTSNSEVMPGVHLIWVEAPCIASIARPGQFVMVRCGVGFECLLPRPLSIHQRNGDDIALLFQVVGKGTHWLSCRQCGDKLGILGPLGNGYSIAPDSKSLLLVAGGIGIAPLCFLAQQALNQGCLVTLLLGASTVGQLYPGHLLPSAIDMVAATEDGTSGRKGMVTGLLPGFINRADQIFACGPPGMYRTMVKMPELKNKPVQISLEARMACGLGVCYGCTVKTKAGLKQVCKDGPVFDLDDIFRDGPGDIQILPS